MNWIATAAEHKENPTCGNLFLHFLSNIHAHTIILQEAGTIRSVETDVLKATGKLIDTSPDNILLCVARDNPWPGAYIKHIAGTRVVKRYKGSPWCYAIFEICLRHEPSREHWEQASLHKDEEAQLETLKAEHPAKDKIRKCGMQLYAFVPST